MTLPKIVYWGLAPEMALLVGAFAVLIVGAVGRDRVVRPYLWLIASASLVASLVFCVTSWREISEEGAALHLAGMLASDGFAVFCKAALAIFGLLTVWLARDYLSSEGEVDAETKSGGKGLLGSLDAEFYGLVLFAVAGMMLMASSADLIMIFLALETFSVALYVLVGFRRRSLESQESAMKYFLLGAFSSAFFLLGIALAYGATGTTNLYSTNGGDASLTNYLGSVTAGSTELLILGAGLILIGLGFKVAAVPFHMWTPDAYQGAPAPVTGFMAAGSKLAGFAALLRVFDVALFPLREEWQPLILVLATVTMVVGSILAVVQEDLKRVLAYSAIAHAGFVLVGVVTATEEGIAGSLFYLFTYGLTVVGAFAIVAVVAGKDERRVRLTDFRGLFFTHPLLAGALTLFLLSLAGVPLTSGFVGKFLVFGAAVEAGYSWLVVVGVLASAIAAFFYLRVLVVMYMEEPSGESPPLRQNLAGGIVALTALATLVLGVAWGPLIELAEDATIIFR